jgi:hypothetical protein
LSGEVAGRGGTREKISEAIRQAWRCAPKLPGIDAPQSPAAPPQQGQIENEEKHPYRPAGGVVDDDSNATDTSGDDLKRHLEETIGQGSDAGPESNRQLICVQTPPLAAHTVNEGVKIDSGSFARQR